eukprot:gene9559-1788_t
MEPLYPRFEDPIARTKSASFKVESSTMTKAHVDSFNYMLNYCLPQALDDIDPVVFDVHDQTLHVSVVGCNISQPTLKNKSFQIESAINPSECRQCHISYKGNLTLQIQIKVGDVVHTFDRYVGQVPIMVKSDRCYLRMYSPKENIKAHEEAREMGGYFIVNGNEKVIRLLLMARRNHPICLIRPTYTNRGPKYTEYGVQIRCVRPDETSQRLVLHFIEGGRCTLGIAFRKRQYLIPAIILLRAFKNATEKEIYDAIVKWAPTDSTLKEYVKALISAAPPNTHSQDASLAFLGHMFRVILSVHPSMSNKEVALFFLRKCVFVHIDRNDHNAKYELLLAMIRRLYFLKLGSCRPDSADSPMNQEVLLPGQIYGAILKEQLQEYLLAIRRIITSQANLGREVNVMDQSYFRSRVFASCPDIGKVLEYFLATGNLKSTSGLDQMQSSGFSVVADKLNFLRYLSHFRCVHRGAYFTEMKTTSVRKLLPEAWGFICPVHTPDGTPCGLLNHLTRHCTAQTDSYSPSVIRNLIDHIHALGVEDASFSNLRKSTVDVLLDGCVIGHANFAVANKAAYKLREMKVMGINGIPETLEIALVEPSPGSIYPGLYLFTTPARMLRPVMNLSLNKQELISTFEQVYMDIGVDVSECYEDRERLNVRHSHMECSKHGILSVVASFTPFSDFNQSPRNMYQCQMGKQTMGIPAHTIKHRADNKLYVLNSGQTPVVHTRSYNEYAIDDYPLGNNAIVCVISYTGYDMEDAMIINQASIDRGFMHGRVIKTEIISLDDFRSKKKFGILPAKRAVVGEQIDADGLPNVGDVIHSGDPYYAIIDEADQSNRIVRYKGEAARIEQVRLLASETCTSFQQRAAVTLSINRNPIIGDKFASRHGQKGILSQMLPPEDMPFTESGIIPDILFNPHGFPSRMTIGMLIESMAGKAGSLQEKFYDCTPFQFDEGSTAIEYFGEQLRQAGYNYYGHERMYSGVTGEELEVDIFIGNVYYQRLRHMVSDKYQVRATGAVDVRTQQPLKGRKRQGGVRFGEMERDALLAHGTAFLLHDRLVRCSDDSEANICRECGGMLSTLSVPQSASTRIRHETCLNCNSNKAVRVRIPYVFRYLSAELAGMNIRLNLDVEAI